MGYASPGCFSTRRKADDDPNANISHVIVQFKREESEMILRCSCLSDFQDKRYGLGLRLFNQGKASPGSRLYRCTVCGNERNVGDGDVAQKAGNPITGDRGKT